MGLVREVVRLPLHAALRRPGGPPTPLPFLQIRQRLSTQTRMTRLCFFFFWFTSSSLFLLLFRGALPPSLSLHRLLVIPPRQRTASRRLCVQRWPWC